MVFAGAFADNPNGLCGPLIQQRGIHAKREIVDAENPRYAAFEFRGRAERARDRALAVSQQRFAILVARNRS